MVNTSGEGGGGATRNGRDQVRATRRSPLELRTLLLDAARREFETNGYSGTTNRDVATRAGVALSVLYRHFDSKPELYSEAVLEPFVQAFERLDADWLEQLDRPLADEQLMQVFVRDVYTTLASHRHALDQLALGCPELTDAMRDRVRDTIQRLLHRLQLMTALETNRRGWMSTENIEMNLRVLMSMLLGMLSYSWLLLPEGRNLGGDDVIDGMVRVGLWGMTRRPGEEKEGGRGTDPGLQG